MTSYAAAAVGVSAGFALAVLRMARLLEPRRARFAFRPPRFAGFRPLLAFAFRAPPPPPAKYFVPRLWRFIGTTSVGPRAGRLVTEKQPTITGVDGAGIVGIGWRATRHYQKVITEVARSLAYERGPEK